MDWLFEGNWTVYLVLLLLAAVFVGLWVNDRKRHWLLLLAVPLLLAGADFLIDRLGGTPGAQKSPQPPGGDAARADRPQAPGDGGGGGGPGRRADLPAPVADVQVRQRRPREFPPVRRGVPARAARSLPGSLGYPGGRPRTGAGDAQGEAE